MGVLDFFRKKKRSEEESNGFKRPKGWTTVKIDDTHYEHHIPPEQIAEWAFERRQKDNVLDLITKNGVHTKSHGRSGYFYIVNDGKIAELYFELGVAGLIVELDSITKWVLPNEITLTEKQKSFVKDKIIEWARTTNTLLYT
jgi:hypothetical protein